MTVTIEHLTQQRQQAKHYLKSIISSNPTTIPRIYRIIMDKHTGSIHMTKDDINYERSCYLIGVFHSTPFGYTEKEKATIRFSVLHRFNLKAWILNEDWEAL